MYHIAAIQI